MQQDSPEQIAPEESQTGTALIPGNTFTAKAVEYIEVDGLAIFEGDIVLGTLDEVNQVNARLVAELSGERASAVVITGNQFRWPSGVVPHQVDSSLPDQSRVTEAIAHWESKTNFRFPQRTTETNYITFRPSTGCRSSVGMRRGEQFIDLGPSCSKGNAIHEIGHAIGLWHEQSREDRDAFVTINLTKVKPLAVGNFSQHIADGDDVGPYDYGSIMHYPRDAFSIDGSDTITPKQAGVQIGQRGGLSPGDVAAANSLIPAAPTPQPQPPTAKVPYPGRLLKYPPLTIGEDVSVWQAKMNELGFGLVVDGKYGPASKAACIEFQNQRGLDRDGIVGPVTWGALFGTS